MPKLPTRDSLGGLPPTKDRSITRITPPRFGGGEFIGQGLHDLGRGIAAVGQAAEAQDAFKAEMAYQEFEFGQKQQLDQSMRNIQPGQADGFQDNWQQNYIKSAAGFLKEVPSHLKAKYEQKLFHTEQSMYGAATTFARGEQKRFSVNQISDNVQNIYAPRARTSTTDELPQVVGDYDTAVDANPYVTPVEKDELKRNGRRMIASAHLDTLTPDQIRELRSQSQGQQSVVDKIVKVESGNRYDAKNPNSSASGPGQFIDSTWLTMIKRYRPDVAEGRSDSEILGLRTKKEFEGLSREMTARYAEENGGILQRANIQPTAGNVYLAHFLGPKGALSVLTANPNTPASQVLPPAVIRANGSILAGKTVGEVAAWAERKMGGSTAVTSALTDQDWQRAEAHAVTRQNRQAAEVGEVFERQMTDYLAGRTTSLFERESIEQDPHLTEDKRNTLLRQYDHAAKEGQKLQQILAKFQDPNGGMFNRFDPDEKKAVDRIYQGLGNDPVALRQVVDRTGMVPTSVARGMRAGLVANDHQTVAASATMASNLMGRNPQIFEGVDGQKDIETAAVRFDHFVDHLGYTPEQAAKKMIEMETPEYKAKLKAHLKVEDIDARLKDETKKGVLLSDMMSKFGQYKILGGNLPGTRPTIEANPAARDSALQDYGELIKEQYLRHGDYDLAKAEAAKQLSRIWGISRTNGSVGGVFMRYPPEMAPAFHGIPEAGLKISTQAQAAIREEIGKEVPRGKIMFIPLPKGQTSTPYLSGEAPAYKLAWLDGQTYHELPRGRGFVPDVAAMRQNTPDRKAQYEAARTEVERQDARRVERQPLATRTLRRRGQPDLTPPGELPVNADY